MDPELAAALVRLVPPGVATVGVFVNEPAEAMRAIVERTGVSMVLHGDEPPQVAVHLDRPVLKALGVEAVRDTAWPVETTVLLDVTDRERPNG